MFMFWLVDKLGWSSTVGTLSELGFDPHSIAQFRHLTNRLTKQNSISSFDFNSDS